MASSSPPQPDPAHRDVFASVRAQAREIFLHALAECSIDRAFQRNVDCQGTVLRVCEDLYGLTNYASVLVVAFGKAAHPMASALLQAAGVGLGGFIVDIADPPHQLEQFRYFRGGHPLPNAESVQAARAILRALHSQSENSLVIFLISGGGSSLVEQPLDDEITLDDLAQTYDALVLSGAPITEINAIRKHLSAVKGGRMARAAARSQQVSIMISDVPENALDALASGATMPDSSTVTDCYAIAKKYDFASKFPLPMRELFAKQLLEETPKPGDPEFARSRWWPILSSTSAQKAAAEKATLAGFAVDVDNSCDDWDYARAADYLLARLRKLRSGVSRACLISGGEVTVKVDRSGGIGGRNQQFALYCATKIVGENITVLSAGTDGVDGNSPAAGAVADGTMLKRAGERGLNVQRALENFNAHAIFEPLGDAIVTGPTGNNVRDLRILLAW